MNFSNNNLEPDNLIYVSEQLLESRPLVILDVYDMNNFINSQYPKQKYIERFIKTMNNAMEKCNQMNVSKFVIILGFNDKLKKVDNSCMDVPLIMQINKLLKKYYLPFIYKFYVIGLSKKIINLYNFFSPFISKTIRDLFIFRNGEETDREKKRRLKKEMKSLKRRSKNEIMTHNLDLIELNKYLPRY